MSINERATNLVENGLAKLLFRTAIGMLIAVCAFLLQQANSELKSLSQSINLIQREWAVGQADDRGRHTALEIKLDALGLRTSSIETRLNGVESRMGVVERRPQ